MSVANKHDIATMKFKAADKEAVEKSAKTCWNKLTRFLDKFSEIVFIFCLTANLKNQFCIFEPIIAILCHF